MWLELQGDLVSGEMVEIQGGKTRAATPEGRLLEIQYEGRDLAFFKMRTSYQLAIMYCAGWVSNRQAARSGALTVFEYRWTANLRVELLATRSTLRADGLAAATSELFRARRLAERPRKEPKPGGDGILQALTDAARDQQRRNEGRENPGLQRRRGGAAMPLMPIVEEDAEEEPLAHAHDDEASDSDVEEWRRAHRDAGDPGAGGGIDPEEDEVGHLANGDEDVEPAAPVAVARSGASGLELKVYRLQTERSVNREPWMTALHWHLEDGTTGGESACWRRLPLARLRALELAKGEMARDRVCAQCLEARPELERFFRAGAGAAGAAALPAPGARQAPAEAGRRGQRKLKPTSAAKLSYTLGLPNTYNTAVVVVS